jgi:hypothetical protein
MESGPGIGKTITIGSRTLEVEQSSRFRIKLASAIADEEKRMQSIEGGSSTKKESSGSELLKAQSSGSHSALHMQNATAAASAQLAGANNVQGAQNQVAQILSQASQAGLLRINGNPQAVQETAQMLTALATSNPDVMQNLMEKFQTGQGLEINTQNSGGPISQNMGNSRVNAIGGNQIILDFGDASIGGQGGMLTVLAHELLHTEGATHGAAMDQATLQDIDNVFRYMRSA